MKTKYYLILPILFIVMIFALGCAPQQQTKATESSAPNAEKTSAPEIKQTREDFGCFYSCDFFPAGSKQMCEDWKAERQVQWPPDCKMMQYGPCIQLCEAEKKRTVSVGEQKQTFNTLPSLVQAEFASDVNEADKGFVITGISAMDFYLQEWFGKSINQPAGLRVNAGETNSVGGDSQVVMEDGKWVILIATGSPLWKSMIELNNYGGEFRNWLPAHEYVHIYQAHNGCNVSTSKRVAVGGDNPSQNILITPRWFSEGEAEWLTYKVMQEAGMISSWSSTQQVFLPRAKQQVSLLKSFEKKKESGDSYSDYPLFTMAVDYLMKDRQIETLDDFCANIRSGMDMPSAFEDAFGIHLEKFYEDFESYRKTW